MKIQIKSLSGAVLFEHEQENNTIKETLIEAVSQGAYLQGADLEGADLQGAYLRRAHLQGADLRRAHLQGADLQGADLEGADLRRAYLRGAYLQGAYLQGADLQGAYLQGADLQGAKNADLVIAQTRILPEGDIIGYKKCIESVIVKLLIPKEAKRSHAFGRKCRAEFAQVLEIYGATEAVSSNDPNFIYRVGEMVRPIKSFDEDWTNECSSGIHFFITKIEAENY